LVTGSTDGIGKAYAFALAERGLHIILVSRNPSKLEKVASEIESQCKVKTKIVAIDFTNADEEYAPRLEKEIKGLEIGVLVNNVGIMYDYPEEFLLVSDQTIRDLVNVNIASMNAMTRLCLPGMVQRKKGAVINISSISSITPAPLLSAYGATKAYVDKLSVGLDQEYGRKGITIQTVLPGYVVSNMSRVKESMTAPSPDAFVKSALSRLGIYSRTTGFWSHDLLELVNDFLPESVLSSVVFNLMDGVRKRKLAERGIQN
jgi:17beta-estradiol 17-dehydrogenase / very-long-chain 3-oxoacyl-CoA reductase